MEIVVDRYDNRGNGVGNIRRGINKDVDENSVEERGYIEQE